jgi:hypothetical protein
LGWRKETEPELDWERPLGYFLVVVFYLMFEWCNTYLRHHFMVQELLHYVQDCRNGIASLLPHEINSDAYSLTYLFIS